MFTMIMAAYILLLVGGIVAGCAGRDGSPFLGLLGIAIIYTAGIMMGQAVGRLNWQAWLAYALSMAAVLAAGLWIVRREEHWR